MWLTNNDAFPDYQGYLHLRHNRYLISLFYCKLPKMQKKNYLTILLLRIGHFKLCEIFNWSQCFFCGKKSCTNCSKYLLMLKRSGRWTNLIILRRGGRILNFLFNVRHGPVISNHIFGAATGHHTNLEQSTHNILQFRVRPPLLPIPRHNAALTAFTFKRTVANAEKQKKRQSALQSAAFFSCRYF